MKINKCMSGQMAAVILAVGLTTSTGLAATVNWGFGAQNITGDTNVSTDGTLVNAFHLGGASTSSAIVNGVTFGLFVPSFLSSTNITSGNYSLTKNATSGTFQSYNSFGTGYGAYASLSSSYQNLLSSGGGTTASASLALDIGGLTIGQAYEFQWWDSDSSLTLSPDSLTFNTTATAGNAVSLAANNGSTLGSLGQFAIGIFTADSATEVIHFNGNTGANDPLIDAFQLREITVAPEPSTWALVAVGLVFVGQKFYSQRIQRRSTV